jgi:hypothetical protein
VAPGGESISALSDVPGEEIINTQSVGLVEESISAPSVVPGDESISALPGDESINVPSSQQKIALVHRQ